MKLRFSPYGVDRTQIGTLFHTHYYQNKWMYHINSGLPRNFCRGEVYLIVGTCRLYSHLRVLLYTPRGSYYYVTLLCSVIDSNVFTLEFDGDSF